MCVFVRYRYVLNPVGLSYLTREARVCNARPERPPQRVTVKPAVCPHSRDSNETETSIPSPTLPGTLAVRSTTRRKRRIPQPLLRLPKTHSVGDNYYDDNDVSNDDDVDDDEDNDDNHDDDKH